MLAGRQSVPEYLLRKRCTYMWNSLLCKNKKIRFGNKGFNHHCRFTVDPRSPCKLWSESGAKMAPWETEATGCHKGLYGIMVGAVWRDSEKKNWFEILCIHFIVCARFQPILVVLPRCNVKVERLPFLSTLASHWVKLAEINWNLTDNESNIHKTSGLFLSIYFLLYLQN